MTRLEKLGLYFIILGAGFLSSASENMQTAGFILMMIGWPVFMFSGRRGK